MSVLYPVAETAEAALHAPLGFAARERGAKDLAGVGVVFATEPVGPAFATREEALDAFPGRVDDERPGKAFAVAPEARWCALTPVVPEGRGRPPALARPVNRDGRRWPEPAPGVRPAVWRLSVSYWRVVRDPVAGEELEAARTLRRGAGGEGLEPDALRALASQPLRPVRPQQPLDIGLFETRPPEAPHIVMPDE